MNKLHPADLMNCVRGLPAELIYVMSNITSERLCVAGGYITSTILGKEFSDIDIFIKNPGDHVSIRSDLRVAAGDPNMACIETNNAITLKGFNPNIQIIHKWTFRSPKEAADSFDFTCCAVAIWFDSVKGEWDSYCVDTYYSDLAAKRIVYQFPTREENPSHSITRIQKYIKKGYTIDSDSLAGMLARFFNSVQNGSLMQEKELNDKIYSALNEGDDYPDDAMRVGTQARFEQWLNAQTNGPV